MGEEVKEEMEKDVNLYLEYFVVHNFQVEENINNNKQQQQRQLSRNFSWFRVFPVSIADFW